MQSLAILVAILFLSAIISGPITIVLSFINFRSIFAIIAKRIIQALFAVVGVIIGLGCLFNSEVPLIIRLIGIASVHLSIFGLLNEYVVHIRLPGSKSPSRSNGRSNGNDGHGPGGQH